MTLRVGDLMIRNDQSLRVEATVAEAIEYLGELNTSAVPVCAEGGSVKGVITAQRCAELNETDPDTRTRIGYLLEGDLVAVDIAAHPETALQLMSERRVQWLVVQESGLLAGLVDWDTLAAHIAQDRLTRIQKRALKRRSRGRQPRPQQQPAERAG